jgi:putative tryptophan/tyrosine transport system substrate-binding protein
MVDKKRRREFITLLGGAAAWPLAAHAQQAAMPVVGFLNGASAAPYVPFVDSFRRGLGEIGFIEGQNVAIEFRWAEGQYDRLPALAADLVRRQVAVIVATGGPASGQAAKAATATIPIVFNSGTDPVQEGLVASFNRPGGNATGVNVLLSAMEGKRLGLLREMVPNAALIAVLLNPAMPTFDGQVNDVQAAARSVGQRLHILRASNDGEIDAAFTTAAELRAGALLVGADPFMFTRRERLLGLASRYAIPAIYELREYAAAGGLMSYGISLAEAYRLVGVYTGRILKGDKPADLPVQQLTKFEFVINLKSAKALGIEVPPGLSARADEIIE